MTDNRYDRTYGNNSDNYETFDEDLVVTLSEHTTIRGTLESVGQFTHDTYGQSLIVNIGDVELLDGVLMPKKDKEANARVFNVEELGYERDEIETLGDLPDRKTISVAGNKHKYELEDAAVEGEEGEIGDPVELGNVKMFLSNSSKGSSAAEVLTTEGRDKIGDTDDDYNWLVGDAAALRGELEGREVELFFKRESYEKGDDTVTYIDCIVLDSDSKEVIKPNATASSGTSGADDGIAPEEEATSVELPGHIDPLKEMFIDQAEEDGVPQKENVVSVVEDQVDDDEDVSEYADLIIEEVEKAV